MLGSGGLSHCLIAVIGLVIRAVFQHRPGHAHRLVGQRHGSNVLVASIAQVLHPSAQAVFLVLGGFTLDGLMLQLDNLASRFVAADASRRGQFAAISFGVMLTGFVLIAFFRRASLISAFLVAGDDQ